MITRCKNCGGIVAFQLEGNWKVDYCYRPYCAYGDDGDSWTYHEPVWIKCGKCESEFDQQEDEGNICPACKEKEGK